MTSCHGKSSGHTTGVVVDADDNPEGYCVLFYGIE
jgi:hypothetical protein